MRIDRVTIKYGELRSTGFPNFSNTRHEVELSAMLEPGDTAAEVRNELHRLCRNSVKRLFGDNVDENQLEIPF